MKEPRTLQPKVYTISLQDMLDIWVESLHEDDHLLAIWDVRNHLELMESCGLLINKEKIYNNKVLTVVVDDVRDAFYFFDLISSHEGHPFVQVYSEGKLLLDNIGLEN